jgi:RNA polymerase primary sigma factor
MTSITPADPTIADLLAEIRQLRADIAPLTPLADLLAARLTPARRPSQTRMTPEAKAAAAAQQPPSATRAERRRQKQADRVRERRKLQRAAQLQQPCPYCDVLEPWESTIERGHHLRGCVKNPRRKRSQYQPDAEGRYRCAKCETWRTRDELYWRQTSAAGEPYPSMPCIACQNRVKARRATPEPSTVETPCAFCGRVGLDGRPTWETVQQRAAHMGRCPKNPNRPPPVTPTRQPRAQSQRASETPPAAAEPITTSRVSTVAQGAPPATARDEPPAADAEPLADDLGRYLAEIGRVPLLTAARERELAEQIDAGRAAAKELEQLVERTPSEVAELRRRVERGASAREQLTSANLRLVVNIAKHYRGGPLPMLDLIQEGNIGLMTAVERYQLAKGTRFTTYATWWIRQSVSRALEQQGATIRVPTHMHERRRAVKKAIAAYVAEHEHEPSVEQIATRLGVDVAHVAECFALIRETRSLHELVGEQRDTEIGELIGDERADPASDVEQLERRRVVADLLAWVGEQLTPRHADLLRLRHGFGDDAERTLEQVGEPFGITRERARQLVRAAYVAIRERPDAHELAALLV